MIVPIVGGYKSGANPGFKKKGGGGSNIFDVVMLRV